jgi:hypothetical protein
VPVPARAGAAATGLILAPPWRSSSAGARVCPCQRQRVGPAHAFDGTVVCSFGSTIPFLNSSQLRRVSAIDVQTGQRPTCGHAPFRQYCFCQLLTPLHRHLCFVSPVVSPVDLACDRLLLRHGRRLSQRNLPSDILHDHLHRATAVDTADPIPPPASPCVCPSRPSDTFSNQAQRRSGRAHAPFLRPRSRRHAAGRLHRAAQEAVWPAAGP